MYGQKVNTFEQLWEGVPKGISLEKSGGFPYGRGGSAGWVPMWVGVIGGGVPSEQV